MTKNEKVLILALCLVLLILISLVYRVHRSEKDWLAYLRTHNCVQTGSTKTSITMMPITQPNGTTILMPVHKVEYEWRCENDEKIWRM